MRRQGRRGLNRRQVDALHGVEQHTKWQHPCDWTIEVLD